MGGNRWMTCKECERQSSLTIISADPPGAVNSLAHHHPAIALYARPPGQKGMVRVGWLLRCGHTVIENNPAEGLK